MDSSGYTGNPQTGNEREKKLEKMFLHDVAVLKGISTYDYSAALYTPFS